MCEETHVYWTFAGMKMRSKGAMRIRFLYPLLAAGLLHAADPELKRETLKAWDNYIHSVDLTLKQQLQPGHKFLWSDENTERAARVQQGEIVVGPASEAVPKRVPSGLIHDWFGAAFLPNARIEDVVAVTRDYSHYKDVYKPGVLDGKLLRGSGPQDEFAVIFRNGSYLKKTALQGFYKSSFCRLGDDRAYSVTTTTHVQEIENYGGPEEHKLPVDTGRGYIWRVFSIAKFEQRQDGVVMNIEAIVLSRDVPVALRWLAGPIIRRVSRETLSESLRKTRAGTATRLEVISQRNFEPISSAAADR